MNLEHLLHWPAGWPLLLLAPALWAVLGYADLRRSRRLSACVAAPRPGLVAELVPGRRRLRRLLAAAACACAVLALLQPAGQAGGVGRGHRGTDLVVCLDVSRSMLARDLQPSRLLAARAEIAALAARARGDRIGLVVFAGEARLLVPPTTDMDSLVRMLDLAEPLAVRRPGTDLGQAIDCALLALAGTAGEHAAILLLTDGEDHAGTGLRAAAACRERGIPVHCVGFGTPLGAKIPVPGAQGEAYLRAAGGDEIVSTLDPTALARIADATRGRAFAASTRPRPLAALYEQEILPRAQQALAAREQAGRVNLYQAPLLAAFLLWLLDSLLGERRRR